MTSPSPRPLAVMNLHPADKAPPKAVRASRFSFKEPTLLCPRVRLFPDDLVLEGWQWRGRYHRQIALSRILQIDVTSTGRLLLWLTTGETIRLRVDEAEAWKQAIEAQRERPTRPLQPRS